jgi:lysophospholipase L1-like esterase
VPSRAGLWIVRILTVPLVLGVTTAWSASAQSPAMRPRVAIIGDSGAGPDASILAYMVAQAWPGLGLRTLTDYSQPGAGLDAIIRRQLGPLIDSGADLVILRIGPADLDAAETTAVERPIAEFSALLATVLTRTQARVIVTTIPRPLVDPATDRLAAVRRIRRVEMYNDAIGAMAQRAGAGVIAGDAMADAQTWRAVIDWTRGREPAPLPSQHFDPGEPTPLSAAEIAALRERARAGRAVGQRPEVLAKVGDSMTAAPEFLPSLLAGGPEWTAAPALAATAAFFNSTPATANGTSAVDGVRDAILDRDDVADAAPRRSTGPGAETSFARRSLAAQARWAAADVLAGGADNALTRELDATRPAVAVVMFGTNDLTRATLDEFETAMAQLLVALESAAVIPLLTTIPMRTDRADFGGRVPAFNAAIRALATVYGVPLIDYGRAMAQLPNYGLADDGIHPSVCPEGPQVLTAACLQYGYNLRNLLTLQALDMLRRLVLTAEDVQ